MSDGDEPSETERNEGPTPPTADDGLEPVDTGETDAVEVTDRYDWS